MPALRAPASPPRPAAFRVVALLVALVLLGSVPAEAASVVTAGWSGRREVALTFDDGWDRGACASITDTLRRYNVVGTFFINGLYVAGAPAAWRRILRGMPVGNHTRAHVDLSRLSSSSIRHQIASNERLLERVLGRPMKKLLRPPYGAYDSRVRSVARSLGYRRIVLWSVDTNDWVSGTSSATIAARATSGGPGSIILMHCGPSATARALPSIIRSYKARGYRLVGVGQLLRR